MIQLEALPGVVVSANALVFPGPHSATGEDVIELHMPGSQPLVTAVLHQLIGSGCRLAEPGEFTRRAFINGRLDLTQAEAVLELVEARSSASARAATQVLGGSLGGCMSSCREVLVEALSELEAGLDFEEGDSQDLAPGEVGTLLDRASDLLEEGLSSERQRLVRHGGNYRIALFGAPNAGKTTLFSKLTGEAALISAGAGTTRDRREAQWHMPGSEMPLTLIDFPGVGGETVDARDLAARNLLERSEMSVDLLWLCVAPDTQVEDLPSQLPAAPSLVVWTKADCESDQVGNLRLHIERLVGQDFRSVAVSSVPDGAGEGGFRALSEATLDSLTSCEKALSNHILHSERYQESLAGALLAVARARQWDEQGGHQDLVAEELRQALSTLAILVGEFTPEDVLDKLFSSFCIGK